MRLRLPLVMAAVLMALVPPPADAAETSTPASAAPSSGSLDHPNVGDEAPHKEGFGENRGLLSDEEGLLALGFAVVIGASTAIVVMRRRNRQSLY